MIFVAEIGSAHKGDKSLAFEYIRQSAVAGADIAKFQLFGSHPLGNEAGKEFRNAPMEWVEDLDKWCKYFDIEIMASIWSIEGLEAARSVGMKRYKISHQMMSVLEGKESLVNEIIREGKETFTSGRESGLIHQNTRGISCMSGYPTYPRDLYLPDKFGEKWYGYSSHVHGYADALLAVARGAQYIEKHVTLDKTEDSIRDNHFALSFQEFGEMVKIGREMARIV